MPAGGGYDYGFRVPGPRSLLIRGVSGLLLGCPWRRLLGILGVAVLLSAMTGAMAARIEIETDPDDEESRLEQRHIVLPDGTEVQLYVLEAKLPFTIRFEDNVITATHVEFDLHAGIIRVIGAGTFESPEERIEGDDFVVELDDDVVRGRDVLIFTEAIDVRGMEATRVPGQVDILSGSFSPCSRCGQEVEDYGFRAQRLQLYPGDRLIAFEVTLLIREVPVMMLPVLVIPLGPPERQPRLAISQGTETERAEVELDWPYTVGPNAFGIVSLRYFADVVPGEGNLFTENLLGGRTTASYLGGGIRHWFYTDGGDGQLEFAYLPSFIDSLEGGKTDDEFTMRFQYETLPAPDEPDLDLWVERIDGRRQRLVEYRFVASHQVSGVEARYLSQGYFDLDPSFGVRLPSYATRAVPERTVSRLTLLPEGDPTFAVGPLRISGLRLDLGVFEDQSNPANRRAAQFPRVTAGRILAAHALRLEPVPLWPGLSLRGESRFAGRYYSTEERLVDWQSNLELRQALGGAGDLSVTFVRNTVEGETPFRFEQMPLRSRTEVRSRLSLRPLPWLSLAADQTYVVFDSRNPREIGPGDLNSRLTLFENLPWLGLTFENSYDLEEGEPGNLTSELLLRSPDRDIGGSLRVRHVQDLSPSIDPVTGEVRSDSRSEVRAEAGFRPYLTFDLSGGFVYHPEVEADEPAPYWEPLELGLTAGTLDLGDGIPGLRASYSRDLNRRESREFGIQATAAVGPVEASLEQRFDYRQERLGTSRYRLTWRGVASLEASGFALIPPSWVGLEIDPPRSEDWRFDLRDAARPREEQWRLTYRTTFDPNFTNRFEEQGGFRNSRLEAFVNLDDQTIGELSFRLDFYLDLRLRDDERPTTFLQRSSLTLLTQFSDWLAVQGSLGYAGTYSPALDELTRSALSFDDFAVTVRPFDELYVSAVFNDVWDFTGDVEEQSPWNFQPTFYVVWDRCCWALYGAWDSMTGQLRLAITTPGGAEGLQQEFDTPLTLPGRDAGAP